MLLINLVSLELKKQQDNLKYNNKQPLISKGNILNNKETALNKMSNQQELKTEIIKNNNNNRLNQNNLIKSEQTKKPVQAISILNKIKDFFKFQKKSAIEKQNEPLSQPARKKFEVEFLTEEVAGVKILKQTFIILFASVVFSLTLVIGFFYLFSWLKDNLQNKVKNLENKIAEMKKESAEDLKTKEESVKDSVLQVEAIYKIVSSRVPWITILNNLEVYTLPTVYYEGLTLDGSGKYVFKAKTKSFEDIINQVEIFRSAKDFILTAEADGFNIVKPAKTKEELSSGTEEPISESSLLEEEQSQYIEFNLSLELTPKFLAKNQEIAEAQTQSPSLGVDASSFPEEEF